ncbi:hypothetical protein [Kordia sp.]|uniref:hypothetical protein n=1 Tax=Kordia sp. TaxID=1965332 RepID=UPI003D2D2151
MKKKNLKNLLLSKKNVSNLNSNILFGGKNISIKNGSCIPQTEFQTCRDCI